MGTLGCSDGTGPSESGRALSDVIQLPPGFEISVFAEVTRPRSMALAEDGTVFVGTYFFTKGVTSPVYALRDLDGDHRVDRVWNLRNEMGTPPLESADHV